jgi:hypothetical protein
MNIRFTKRELFILALIFDREAIMQIFRDPRYVADLLIAELRITMLEEPVLLANFLGQDAADPDCSDNLSLFSKLRSVDQQSMPELIAAIEHHRFDWQAVRCPAFNSAMTDAAFEPPDVVPTVL